MGYPPEAFFIELQRLCYIIEHAQVIHDQAVGLGLAEGAVGPANGLQEVVVLHRLVEIHHLQDGRIEAGQPHVAHDDQFSGSHPTIEIEAP